VGWFDSAGEGELKVALRCGLLDGPHALIYAGAGILPASDPEAEYGETALKQEALGAALGLSGAKPKVWRSTMDVVLV
jgi:menaquinone-specific isochorismate synthase